MKTLEPYLFFNGQCRQALEFYRDCLGGEITQLQTFDEAPGETPAGAEGRVMHACFQSEGIQLMASDGMPDQKIESGGQITLNLNFDDHEEQAHVFNTLSDEGKVDMPLQDTLWGARFGMLTDRYGIHWMLNYSHE